MVKPLRGGSERLLTFRLNSTEGPITLVSVYALTLSATSDAKDEFYEKLASIIRSIASTEQLIILGDFNARVGADCDSWPSCLGPFGVGKLNENGQRLLELCTFLNLCITNSFFKTKPQHKVSWSHPRSKHWHQLDLIMVRHAAIKNVLRTPTERNLQMLRAARNKVQHTARRCANEYWTELSETIQTDAAAGNIRGTYEGIKKVLGITQSKTPPPPQIYQWRSHY